MGLLDADGLTPSQRQKKRLQGLLAPTNPAATTTQQQTDPYNIGGETPQNDIRGTAKDLRSFDSVGAYFNDPMVQRDFRALGDMITGVSPTLSAGNMVTGGYQGMGPQVPAFGIDPAVNAEIEAAAIGGGGSNQGNAGSWGGTGEKLATGGTVRRQGLLGPDPEGPDEGYAALKGGEWVLNEDQQGQLSPSARKEVQALVKAADKKRKK